MKISFHWLKTFLDVDMDSGQISEILTDLGLEVEGLELFESVPGSLEGVVVGEVLECRPHPNADKLKLTRVDIGNGRTLQIVCGAPNVAQGQKVPVATIGTVLYGPEGDPWKIKKGKIRGELSEGMICAEDELNLGPSHDGIMVLDPELSAGTACSQVFETFQDEVFEIGLTPNRSDAMCHFGVARDLRAGLIQRGYAPELKLPSCPLIEVENSQEGFQVIVDTPDLAPRYAGVLISGVELAPSPAWLQDRLNSIGLKPINNIVDITNFVMHDVGQPLHAFDLDKIADRTIRVGQVADGTPFISLDGEERILHSEDLLICDSEKPLCIAGVYGGLHSGVSETTTAIFLESAFFDPVSIRRTAKRHGLSTDASFRFERGIDFEHVHEYLCYAARLITEIAGGKVDSLTWDLYEKKRAHQAVEMSLTDVNRVAGKEIPAKTILQILESLDIEVLSDRGGLLIVQPPQYRQDVTRKIDIIEEVLRVYGYNSIESSHAFNFALPPFLGDLNEVLKSEVSRLLCYQGYTEIMTNSLVPVVEGSSEENSTAIRLLNPLSSELAGMRSELLNSGLQVVAHNLNHRQTELLLFEFGHVYWRDQGNYHQETRLGIWCARAGKGDHWIPGPNASRFFELKGTVDSVFDVMGLGDALEEQVVHSRQGEALAYVLKGTDMTLATVTSVERNFLEGYDIECPMAYADLHWDAILEALSPEKAKYIEIPKFPEVHRDISLLLEHSVSFKALESEIYETDRKLIKGVSLFDVFEGKGLEQGKKAYGLRIRLQDRNKTLTDKNIDKVMNQVIQKLEKKYGAQLR